MISFKCKTCGDCAAFFPITQLADDLWEGECRLYPPTSVRPGARAGYPTVVNYSNPCSIGEPVKKVVKKLTITKKKATVKNDTSSDTESTAEVGDTAANKSGN